MLFPLKQQIPDNGRFTERFLKFNFVLSSLLVQTIASFKKSIKIYLPKIKQYLFKNTILKLQTKPIPNKFQRES